MPDEMLSKILSKREKILSLPEGVRDRVVERLFDKAVGSKIPKAMDEGQRNLIKQRFVDQLIGVEPTSDPGQSPEDRARSERVPHGAFGVARAGLMEGLANILTSLRGEAYKLHYGNEETANQGDERLNQISQRRFGRNFALLKDSEKVIVADEFQSPGSKLDNYATHGLGYLAEHWLRQQAGEQRAATAPYEARSTVHKLPLIGPTTRADFEGGVGKTLASLPIDLATAELIPGAKGAKLGARIASGAGKGAVAGATTNPAFGGSMGEGAAGGALFGGLLPLLGAPFARGAKKAPLRLPATTTPIPGAETGAEALEAIAQKQFNKPLKELSPDQKIELVNKWREDTITAAKQQKISARKAADDAKVQAVISKQTKKIDDKVAIRRAMDEAKTLQKRITEFVKTNKRAPNEQELVALKNSSAEAAPKPSSASVEERGIKKPERRTFSRTSKEDVRDFYNYRFSQLRDEITNAATPEEKTAAEQRLSQLTEVQKAHPTSMGDPKDFKIESPEAVKAVAAVADVAKVIERPASPEIKVIPEGQHGSGDIGRRAKDAERKAAARAKDLREQPEPATPETPESVLLKKEEEFYELTDKIEGMGPKGKEAAKNLDGFRKKGRITMDQALEMGYKVLEQFQKGTVKP